MAVRRPPAPRLQSGRPGAHPVPAAREQLAAELAPMASRTPATAALSGTSRRRVLLLAGSVGAAIALPLSAGALWARRGRDSPAAASSPGGGGTAVGNDLTSPFSDVEDGAVGLEAMLWAEETGVQPAHDASTYDPHSPVTRGDLAVALHRFAGSPELATDAAPALLADVGPDPLYARALLWLHGRGAVWGDQELRVRPESEATRRCAVQMVTALVRPALAGVGVRWDPVADSDLTGLPETEPLAEELHWLSAAGMLIPAQEAQAAQEEPQAGGAWDGDQPLTRAHLAVALHRVDEVIASMIT